MKRSLALIATLASGFVLSAPPNNDCSAAAPAGPAKIAVIAFQGPWPKPTKAAQLRRLQKKYDPSASNSRF